MNNSLDAKISKILSKYNNREKKITNLVLNGGGLKGIAHIGALKVLADNGLLKNINTIVGTSIGGITGALMCSGFTPDELNRFIEVLDIKKLTKLDPGSMLENFGLDDGSRIKHVFVKLLESKNISPDVTLKELYLLSKIKLVMTTTCLNDSQPYYLSYLNYPNLPLVTAVRMTSAIPLVFTPVKYDNKLFSDGGCSDNYPIHLFKDEIDSTLGIYVRPILKYRKDISSVEDFLFSLFDSMLEGVTEKLVKGYEKNTIIIHLPDVAITSENITLELKKKIYNGGYNMATKFLETYKIQ
jgi:NTE family protein